MTSCREWLFGPREECRTCHELRSQLDFAQNQNRYLLGKLLEPASVPQAVQSNESPVPISTAPTPWNIRKSILEKEDRAQAVILKKRQDELKKSKTTDELEKALAIPGVEEGEKEDKVNG